MADVQLFTPRAAHVVLKAAVFASAVAGTLALFGRIWPPFDALANFAPLLFTGALLVLALAWFSRQSRAAIAAALVGPLALAWLITPELLATIQRRPDVMPGAPQIKVLSANLWGDNENHEAIGALIQREQPDIIVFLEAFRPWKAVLERLAPEYRIVTGCQDTDSCDVVILTKLTLVERIASNTSSFSAVRLELPRRFGEGAIEVMGVHLNRHLDDAARRAEVADVTALAKTFNDRAFVTGDFNATPWSSTLRDLDEGMALERRTRALFSWPTPARAFTRWRIRVPIPVAPIDQVYAGRAWRLADIRRGANIGSDHYPIIATFTLSPLDRLGGGG